MDFLPEDLTGLLGPTLGPTELILIAPFAAIWLLLGAVSPMIAKNKGRNGCAWLLLGLLLGPLGFILALVVPKNVPALEQKSVDRGEMQYCPYCAELIRAEAVKCRFCGESFGRTKSSNEAYMRRHSL